jgi:hypothetical protein
VQLAAAYKNIVEIGILQDSKFIVDSFSSAELE